MINWKNMKKKSKGYKRTWLNKKSRFMKANLLIKNKFKIYVKNIK
jgi:hypothetical protein